MRILFLLLLLAACGADEPEKPTSFSTTDSRLGLDDPVERRRQFEELVVGHELRGEGVDVVVAEGGVLVGQQYGRPFSGAWVFRSGEFCYAMAERVTRSNARCFRTALIGDDLHLVPVEN